APATSTVATVTVSPTSVGGTATAAASTVCSNSATTITLNGFTGSIQWQKRTGTSAFANITGQTSPTLNTSNLVTTTDFRATVTSGTCPSSVSSTNTVTVSPASKGGTATASPAALCNSGSSSISLTNQTGNIVNWQSSLDGT